MPIEEFKKLKHLPDPMNEEEGHYISFEEAFQEETSEKDRPSLTNKPRRKSLPFTPSVQHVNNIALMQPLAIAVFKTETVCPRQDRDSVGDR